MTTIAYRDGIVAADSASYGDGCRMADMQKIHRIGDKLVAGVGNLGASLAFVQWVRDGMRGDAQPKLHEDFEALLWDGRRWLWWDHNWVPCEWTDEWWAFGTGHKVATGALAMGATAYQAVEIARRHDPYTDGPIHFERVIVDTGLREAG